VFCRQEARERAAALGHGAFAVDVQRRFGQPRYACQIPGLCHSGQHRGGDGLLDFAKKYDVSLNWPLSGEAHDLKSHLHRAAKGKVMILLVMSRKDQLSRERANLETAVHMARKRVEELRATLAHLKAARVFEYEMAPSQTRFFSPIAAVIRRGAHANPRAIVRVPLVARGPIVGADPKPDC
jgi:hypothetical protein